MILRLKMILSVVFQEKRTFFFYGKNLKLTNNNTFNHVSISFTTLIFPILKVKFAVTEIVKRIF